MAQLALSPSSPSSQQVVNASPVWNGKQTAVDGVDDGNKPATPGRLPRWTRQDILILIEGKRLIESQQGVRTPGGRHSGYGPSLPEPKWEAISSYCRRNGVNRTLAQCRKRWSNLGGDFRKIREWESRIGDGSGESYWVMRSDLKKERKLPGHFDKDIYDMLVGKTATGMELVAVTEEWKSKEREEEIEEEGDDDDEDVLFDSGRRTPAVVVDDGLFSEEEEESAEKVTPVAVGESPHKKPFASPLPLSEKRYGPSTGGFFNQGMANGKQQPGSNTEREFAFQEGRKRKRSPLFEGENISLQDHLIKVLERNNRMLTAQLEAQNINCHLDRDQRKHQSDSLITVLGKMVDALGKIADKL